jgi:hypothetical protein
MKVRESWLNMVLKFSRVLESLVERGDALELTPVPDSAAGCRVV